MSKQIEALKMAIEYIKESEFRPLKGSVLALLKEALAEAEKQEPVAEVIEDKLADWSKPHVAVKWNKVDFKIGTKFYTHPAPSWQGLDGIEILDMFTELFGVEGTNAYAYFDPRKFARAIEQALKELNAKK